MRKKKIFDETINEKFGTEDDDAYESYGADDPSGILKKHKLNFKKAMHHQVVENKRSTKTARTNAGKREKKVNELKKHIIDKYGNIAALEDKKTRKLIRTDAQKKLGVTIRAINIYFQIIRNELF